MSVTLLEQGSESVRVLIVDDDAAIADILKDVVAQEGREVRVCYDGFSAVECLKAAAYDLLILDLMLPGVEGPEVFKVAKQVNPDVLVIIITGYATLETAIAAIREGAYDFIQKPFKLDGFRITVGNAVEKVKLNRENRELLRKLQSSCEELTALRERKTPAGTITSINFLSSSMPSVHYLYGETRERDTLLEKLDALLALKEKGLFSEQEFQVVKAHLLKVMNAESQRKGRPWHRP
ncbi:MAG: response regulator [Desulfobacterota bacterium]|jgi:FixJ family two-component response regulator|nr:response regulator [Thermodesulfobacteriota bacterium]